ncbi:hypothetical protein PRZ48_011518 [Zasmidium cellare]|uniref:Aminotransferase class V domain-containing protein n=1 Tax=Zasmidium cellare TaxID=395010 RepID=A0ABR0E6X1_ZASCE|nr:hypothetical protein PRZ48_011518 [Zasmidium cellare]
MGDYITNKVSEERQRWTKRDSRSPIENGMDMLRLLEYPALLGKTYLDHAGTTVWAKSLTTQFAQLMSEELFGNPHSESTPSKESDRRVEEARRKALGFFNADPEEWDLVFVANATAAIKLVHDCFRDHATETGRNWWYGYHKDAHTSLVGVREGTRMHRCFRSDREVNLWIDSRGLGGAAPHDIGLFAYPAQSNMNGRRLPLDWPAKIRNRVKADVYTLLDAAAYVSTTQLDLSHVNAAPDFVAVSFYKIFGFPNLGALLVKKSSSKPLLSRKFFGGGTVEMVIAVNDAWHSKKKVLHSRLEDGTLPFTSIFALDLAIDIHRKLYGQSPMKYISMHTSRLIKMLYDQLIALRHSNNVPVVRVYKDSASVYGEPHLQGATIAFNIQKPTGGLVSFMEVEKEADAQGIYVRSGSLCNPGGLATNLEWSPRELREAYKEGHKCSEPFSELFGKAIGVVRVSLGAMSNEADCEHLVQFIKETYIDRVYAEGGPIVLPEFIARPRTPQTPPSNNLGKEVAACVLQVSEREVQTPRNKQEPALGLLSPPPQIDEWPVPESRSPSSKEKSLSTKSSSSRIKRFRRSMMEVLHAGKAH